MLVTATIDDVEVKTAPAESVVSPASMYARALVLWDVLIEHDLKVRAMLPEQITDLREVCKFAAENRLRRHHEVLLYTKSRQRGWLSDGGVAWQHARGFFLISETEKKLNASILKGDMTDDHRMISHRVYKPINVHVAFQAVECAFCALLLLPAQHTRENTRAKNTSFYWSDWKLAVCRAHTDRCALRYLIRQGVSK